MLKLKRWFVHARDKNGTPRNCLKIPDFDSTQAVVDELEKRYKSLKKTHNDNVGAQDKFNGEIVDLNIKIQRRLTVLEKDRDNAQWRLSNLECPSKWTLHTEDRLTDLEAKGEEHDDQKAAEELWLNDHAYRKIHKRLCDLEAKVEQPLLAVEFDRGGIIASIKNVVPEAKDAPEKACKRCGGEGKLIGEYGMMSHADGTCPICEGTGRMPKAKEDAQREPLVYCRECDHKVWCPGVDRVEGCNDGERQPPNTCGNCKKAWRQDGLNETVACEEEIGKLKYKSVQREACPHYERREA